MGYIQCNDEMIKVHQTIKFLISKKAKRRVMRRKNSYQNQYIYTFIYDNTKIF